MDLDFVPADVSVTGHSWAPEVVGTVVARPVARSFKTVDIKNYYGPMYDSTVLCEWPNQEG
jgi:hypothetical protein